MDLSNSPDDPASSVYVRNKRKACEDARRWSFLFVAVPLRITGGTGSPLNPVAIL